VFQIAIDESGRGQESDPAFVLAGYAARVQNWEAFSDRWQEILHKRPHLEYLKAKEAYSLQGQFRGWTPLQRDERVLELIALIRQFSPSAVKLVISGKEFEQILGTKKGAFKNVYWLAVASLTVAVLADRFKQHTREKIEFIFDEGTMKARFFEKSYRAMIASLPKNATELLARKSRMENDRKFLPLQAADLLAWNVRNSLQDAASDASPTWMALKTMHIGDASIDRDVMIRLRRGILAELKT
jgi:hypothetical protein